MYRRILVFSLLCLLTLAPACKAKESGPLPWAVEQAEDLQKQIYYQDEVAAQIHMGVLTFSGAETAQQVNEQLAALWQKNLGEHVAYAQQIVDDMEFNGELSPGQLCYTVEEKPAVFYNDGSLLSIVVDGYKHTRGAAHPLTYRYACNFNAVSGQMLSLTDIWGEDAWEYAVAQIRAQIESSNRADDFYPGWEENLFFSRSDGNWYMDAENIYIIYNPYDIGPYALGIVEFTLPRQGKAPVAANIDKTAGNMIY